MLKVADCKRKLKTRNITEKYKILKEVEKGESSASISKNYGVPKQTLSGWLKEKTKLYSQVDKKQNFCEKSQDATPPRWRFRQSMLYVAYYRVVYHRVLQNDIEWRNWTNSFESCKAVWKRVMWVNETNICFRLFRQKITFRHGNFIKDSICTYTSIFIRNMRCV